MAIFNEFEHFKSIYINNINKNEIGSKHNIYVRCIT